MVNTIKFALLCLFIFTACCKETSISFESSNYNGEELNIKGYYYSPNILTNVSSTYFFYENGIILYGLHFQTIDTIEISEKFRDPEYTKLFYDESSQTNWGLFEINNDDIKFEKWEPRECPHPVRREGKIIDNETFVITDIIDDYTNTSSIENDTFFFVPFSPKPDSTNQWIN